MTDIDIYCKNDLHLDALIEERHQESIDYFYDKYSPALYGIIFRILNDKPLAEECLISTFIKAWNEIEGFWPSENSYFTWMLNLARQSALQVKKMQEKKISRIHKNVIKPNEHYSCFELVYLKGLSIAQAAKYSGISIVELKGNIRKDLQSMKVNR